MKDGELTDADTCTVGLISALVEIRHVENMVSCPVQMSFWSVIQCFFSNLSAFEIQEMATLRIQQAF